MKLRYLILSLTVTMLSAFSVSAHDFEVDGFYYNILDSSAKTVEVTYKGSSYSSYNEYSGEVTIPKTVIYSGAEYSVSSIGEYAFYGNTEVAKVTIPKSLLSIKNYAFNACSNLTELVIEDSDIPIEFGVSYRKNYYCGLFRSVPISTLYLGRGYKVIDYDGSVLGGYEAQPFYANKSIKNVKLGAIKAVQSNCFFSCSNIESIDFGTTIESIAPNAFNGCENLKEVLLPNSLRSIGYNAFGGCSNITNLELGNSIETISNDVFNNIQCPTLIIPSTVTNISYRAFSYCTFDKVVFEDSENDISLDSNAFNGTKSKYIYLGRHWIGSPFVNMSFEILEIGSLFSEIKANAFPSCTELKTIVLPEYLTSIGESAFLGCSSILEIKLPKNINYLGDYAFSNCTNLTSIDLTSNIKTLPDNLFSNCQSLKNVILPNTLEAIGKTFYNSGITSIIIPSSVTSIGEDAFFGCTGLRSVTIPSSVTSIGINAFEGCIGLTEVNITDLLSWLNIDFEEERSYSGEYHYYSNPLSNAGCLKLNGTEITDLIIPDGITEIENGPFYGWKGLRSVTIPSSVISIGCFAFYGCTGLTEVNITDLSSWLNIDFKYISEYISSFIQVYFSNPLSNAGCLKLNGTEITDLIIPDGITEIKNFSFYGCDGLTSVTIPNSVTSIGDGAFYDCDGLTEVTIPSSVTAIGSDAFRSCDGLTSVTIPNSVTGIGDGAFGYCSGLTTVNYNATNCTHMPTYEEELAFIGCANLKTLNIGEDVKTIPHYAFYNCSNLSKVTGGNSVTSIGTFAFYGCDKLISAYLYSTRPTSVVVKLTSPTKYKLGVSRQSETCNSGEIITMTGLKPGTSGTRYACLVINNNWCEIKSFEYTTGKLYVNVNGTAGVTTIDAKGSHNADKEAVIKQGLNIGRIEEYGGETARKFTGLAPNTKYYVYYEGILEGGWLFSGYKSFTTGELTWSSEYQATSTTSVHLITATNCDATSGMGIEWRRYGAPSNLKPNVVECQVVDGRLIGSLRGLDPDVYYEYRPYYTSASGDTYYGEWSAFFSGDANVYFEPEVLTYEEIAVANNSATIKGYALEGTDAITEQGFEYWKSPNQTITTSSVDVKKVSASGIVMNATIADLDYNTTYCYRAFVTTASSTYYGDTMEFTTEAMSGIESVEVDVAELTVAVRENPVIGTVWVKVAGTEATECQYCMVSLSGATIAQGSIIADGSWQPVELNCPQGVYILMVTDGKERETLRLIVK